MERLGRGGMGTVYKALHTNLKRIVAVKVLPAKRLAHPRAVALFQREMEAVGKFDHPNIVRAHDAGEANGQHYLVMELVDGINLSRLVRTCGPLPVAVACDLIQQAAIGLQHAHEHGLVHRDVKPSNLMVTPDGTVKVLDLGLARLLVDALESDAQGQPLILGSLEYMAPEQGLDPRNVEHRADIYSLGCTLYCLLAGKPPFLDSGNDTLAAKIRTHAEALATPINHLRPDVPEVVASLLSSMMAKRPGDRPANMSMVAAALAPLAQRTDLLGFLANHQALLRAVTLTDQALGSQHVELSQHGESKPETEARQPWMWRILWFVVGLAAMLLIAATANYLRTPATPPFGREQAAPPEVPLPQEANAIIPSPPQTIPLPAPEANSPAAPSITTLTNSVGMELVLIPSGKFFMGATDDDAEAMPPEIPRHERVIERPFYIGAKEVTVGQFRRFVAAADYKTSAETDPNKKGGWAANNRTSKGQYVETLSWKNPGFPQTDEHPVCVVSWHDAVAFCNWLSGEEQVVYRLPKEHEWEYACRAHTTGIRHCGKQLLSRYDWDLTNSNLRTHPVGQKLPNPFGLYDLYGNVREWCADWYDETLYKRRVKDPTAMPIEQPTQPRCVRGGSFMDLPPFMRTSMRLHSTINNRITNLGFRVVKEVPPAASIETLSPSAQEPTNESQP